MGRGTFIRARNYTDKTAHGRETVEEEGQRRMGAGIQSLTLLAAARSWSFKGSHERAHTHERAHPQSLQRVSLRSEQSVDCERLTTIRLSTNIMRPITTEHTPKVKGSPERSPLHLSGAAALLLPSFITPELLHRLPLPLCLRREHRQQRSSWTTGPGTATRHKGGQFVSKRLKKFQDKRFKYNTYYLRPLLHRLLSSSVVTNQRILKGDL